MDEWHSRTKSKFSCHAINYNDNITNAKLYETERNFITQYSAAYYDNICIGFMLI